MATLLAIVRLRLDSFIFFGVMLVIVRFNDILIDKEDRKTMLVSRKMLWIYKLVLKHHKQCNVLNSKGKEKTAAQLLERRKHRNDL